MGSFKREYMITIEGQTTNGYAEQLYDRIVKQFAKATNEHFEQVNVTLEEL